MKISQEDVILIKIIYLSKQYCARRVLSEFPDKGWKVGSIDSLLKRILKTGTIVPQPGSGRPHSARIAVGDLVLSQEDKPKRHRSAREISYETAILYSSVYRKIFTVITSSHASNDVVLSSCLKPIVSPVSLADKQPYRLQLILLLLYYKR